MIDLFDKYCLDFNGNCFITFTTSFSNVIWTIISEKFIEEWLFYKKNSVCRQIYWERSLLLYVAVTSSLYSRKSGRCTNLFILALCQTTSEKALCDSSYAARSSNHHRAKFTVSNKEFGASRQQDHCHIWPACVMW